MLSPSGKFLLRGGRAFLWERSIIRSKKYKNLKREREREREKETETEKEEKKKKKKKKSVYLNIL